MSVPVRNYMGATAVAMLSLLAGCASHVTVHEVTSGQMDKLSGVPVQLAAQQQITVYQLQSDGTYTQVEQTQYPIADQSRVFSVGICADLFANASLTLALNSDGTLGSAGITSTPSGSAALGQLGTGLSSVATAATTYDVQRLKAEQTALQQSLATIQARQAIPIAQNAPAVAYHQAMLAVLQQEALVDNPPSTATAVDLANAQSQLLFLKYQANVAASELGIAAPFPGASQAP
jgi:hypothetical protein